MSDSYPAFGKVPRWNRNVVVTEKIDGTNGLLALLPRNMVEQTELEAKALAYDFDNSLYLLAGSRTRWLGDFVDNHGFASWATRNAEDLFRLGQGYHYGEWYGQGINRGYGLTEKRFMLFNTARWSDPEVRPESCEVSTVLYEGKLKDFTHHDAACGCCSWSRLDDILSMLQNAGSRHVRGFMNPEGVMIYHKAANQIFKVTLQNDDEPKGKVNENA